MANIPVDWNVPTYTDWTPSFTYYSDDQVTPINLTGYTFALKWRLTPAATPVLSLSLGSGITCSAPATGVISIHATTAQLSSIATGVYSYDLLATSGGGVVTQLFKGSIYLEASMSHV